MHQIHITTTSAINNIGINQPCIRGSFFKDEARHEAESSRLRQDKAAKPRTRQGSNIAQNL